MRRMIAMACVLAMMTGGAWAQHSTAQAPAPQKTQARMKKKPSAQGKSPAQAAAPVEPVPAQLRPPVPATLMNSAPVTPHVTMKDGLLMIDAPNCTLSEVLDGIHRATGAVVEGAMPSERIAVRLGPGNPRQVIAALLEGTPYNYVILGSQESPDAVTRIVLTPDSAQNAPDQGFSPHWVRPEPPASNLPEHTADDDGAAPPATENQPEQAEHPPQGQIQPNTPEQLFRERQQRD